MVGTGVFIEDMQKTFMADVVRILSIVTIITVAMIAILYLIGRSISQPLIQVAAAMRDIASGEADLTRRLDDKAGDEISLLAHHFNKFAANLGTIIQQLGDSAHQLISASQQLERISEAALAT